MTRSSLPILLLLCASFLPVFGQEEFAEDLFYDAEFFYNEEGDFQEAAYLYRKVLQYEPENANVKFMLGMCYNQILGSEREGIPYFLEATEHISLKYKKGRFAEKQAPHHVWFYLAEAYRKTNQIDKALEALTKFKDLKDFERHYNVRITDEEIAAVERSKIIRDAEVRMRALFFNEPINTPENDYNGVISADGKMMIWVNSKTFYEAVYMSRRQGNDWSIPTLITPQIVSDGDLFPTGLSADGTTLLLIKKPKRGDSDIWYSDFDGMLWSPAQPLYGLINSKSNETHASLTPDGERIYFTSDRRGGQGGTDIWYSDRRADGSWGEAENLGSAINTERDETSAYLAPDGNSLLFSSQGHFNMGGFDVFRSDLEIDGTWGEPVNMGFPLNTTGDNTFYVPLNNGMSGLYTRFTDEAVGLQDLWYVEILGEEGFVTGGLSVAIDPGNGLSHKDFAILLINEETGEEIEILYDAQKDSFRALSGERSSFKIISYKQK
ncbi:MAG: tetratricopeptide repeat protein [Bacteroidales bacterium]